MKPEMSRQIVNKVRERGGRFLRKGRDGLYYEISDSEARSKTSQALRHRTFELRNTQNPDRVKMSGRWKHQEEQRQRHQQQHSKMSEETAKASPTVNDIKSNNSINIDNLPPVRGLMEGAAGMPAQLRLGESKIDNTLLRDALHRQRIMDASMASTAPTGNRSNMTDDYINALAALKHREAMLNLDKAIHEARALRLAASAMKQGDTQKDKTSSDGSSAATSTTGGFSGGTSLSQSLAASLNTHPLLSGFAPGSVQERLAFHSSLLAGMRQGQNAFPPMASTASLREKMLQLQMQQQLFKSVSSSVDSQQLLERMKNARSPL